MGIDTSTGKERDAAGSVAQSRRDDDMSAEAQLCIFLDKYLYEKFPKRELFSKIERIRDKEEQLAGVDVRFTEKNGTVYNVDEKAQLYYLNKDLPTFAFEIQFMRAGRAVCGWLCNDRLKTDLYLLIWPFVEGDRDADTPKGIRWEQFVKADCLLVQKKKILSMLEQEGLTRERMMQEAEQLRKDGRTGKVSPEGVKGIYYFVSDPQKYSEAPINIVIRKERLLSIAQRRYIVTTEGVDVRP